MKRLQLRHHDELFSSRDLALEFFSNILNPNHVNSEKFGTSLYAEPMVAKYTDKDGKVQILFAIGTDTPDAPYHIIDSAELSERIDAEAIRAIASESIIQGKVDEEIERAKNEEEKLQNNIDAEIIRATEAENSLNIRINENFSTIVSVEPSSANILEEYALKNSKNEILGENIKIYKDSSLVGATTGFKGAKSVEKIDDSFVLTYDETTRDENIEYLYLIYRDEKGVLKLVGIDFENFLMEAEFGDGIKVVDHVASIKIKDGEKYLQVDKTGLSTINIDETISDLVNVEKVRAESKEEELQNSLNNEITRALEVEGKLTSDLNREIERALSVEENLQKEINTVSGTISTFLSAAEIGDAAVDTLKEIQNYISTDGAAAAKMTEDIALNKKAIEDEKTRAESAEKNAIKESNFYTDGKVADLTSYVNTFVSTSVNSVTNALNETVKNESNRAIAAENLLSDRINTEESLRITGDNEIRTFIGEENSRVINIINQEVTNRSNEITRVEGILNQEIINREAADAEIVEVVKIEAKNVAAEEVAKIIDGADSSYDTLKEIAEWIVNDTTGSAQMANDIKELQNNVKTLNSDKNVIGSVKSTVVDGVNNAMIINGPTVTVVTPEDAANVGSLLRKVIISDNNDTQYYVSNKATEMLYVPKNGAPVNLNDYITSLETKVLDLEARINHIEENGTGTSVSPEEVKNIIKDYIKGFANEIEIKPETSEDGNETLVVKFADDAIFG